MPRTLPWLKKSASSVPPALIKAEDRRKAHDSDTNNHSNPMPTKKRPRAERLKSSSPPPAVAAAPPTEEFMHEGYHRDDIYIMVEDEFHAVACSFTKHLHQAEYERFKTLAKARNASSTSTNPRPVDSITAIRLETKKRKEAEARGAKNKVAMEQLGNPAKRMRSESDSSDLEGEDRDDKHWKGTALQGLMSKSPRKNQTSLVGLRGVKSCTRAAAGYSKAENGPARSAARTFDLAPSITGLKKKETQEPYKASTSDGSGTDDLNASAPKRPVIPPQKPVRKFSTKSDLHFPLSTKPPESKTNILRSQTLHSSKNHPSTYHPDSKSVPPSNHLTEAARARLKARVARENLHRKKDVTVNVNEIPVFLV